MFDLGGAPKTEHYEIASYRGLIEKANLMGQQECAGSALPTGFGPVLSAIKGNRRKAPQESDR